MIAAIAALPFIIDVNQFKPELESRLSTALGLVASVIRTKSICIECEVKVTVQEIKKRVEANRENIIQFLRDIVAIPSMDGQLKDVGECIQAKMRNLGFDEARFDKMGNTVGRIGDGPKKIVFDSHIDTVGVGDPSEWEWDPFVGKVENGILFARGACDEKNSTPGMVHGLAIARDLGLDVARDLTWHEFPVRAGRSARRSAAGSRPSRPSTTKSTASASSTATPSSSWASDSPA